MRRFRFIGETEEGWLLPVKRGEIYFDNYFFGRGGSLISEPLNQSDWQEVFDEPNPLHKDTDLGYFTIEIMKSIIKIAPLQKPNPEATNELFCKDCISLAKELIKQLNEETK